MRIIEANGYPILDDDGTPERMTGTGQDVTELRDADRAVREAEERFRGAFEEAPIGMALLELDGRFTQVNDALCSILDYPREQMEAMRVESITHPDDLEATERALAEMRAATRTSYSAEKRYLAASGRPLTCALQATVIVGSDGRPSSVLAQIQDITDRKRNEEQLEYLADHDGLTGLLNRRAFARELASHAELAERYGGHGAVLMIDLDQFKFVNDTLGHRAGDELIVRVAQLLLERLRTSDVLARLGGDEFAALLPRADLRTGQLVAQSLLETMRSQAISIMGTERKITASIGMASFADGTGLSGEDVLINADLALYDAKEDGRDRLATFSTEQHSQTRMKGRITWARKISSALETDNFTLLAQPIIDLATKDVSQYELLLRMNDEHGDLIPPSAFLYIAERLDQIQDIDAWVVTNGIRALAEVAPANPNIALEINLSGRSLGDQKLLEHIDSELRNARISPSRIIFEVTETAALTSVTRARAFGEHLSEIGCRFALDDFGAGFGSFYYLKHLVFDYLKIDGEFIRDCRSNDTDKLVIKAIVDIARGMGKQTIAEFVGDDETMRLLRRLGVDYGQGYHIGVPADLREQLAARARLSAPLLT
jgi:diguanylate cyclase (GGDEF)-like protein/PAS domain S-box-containing protein